MTEIILGIIALAEFAALCAGAVAAARFHSTSELDHRAERAQLINAWTLERATLMDRIQAGDVEQYHALQRAYVEQQMEPEINRWNHDEFGFVSEPAYDTPGVPGAAEGEQPL